MHNFLTILSLFILLLYVKRQTIINLGFVFAKKEIFFRIIYNVKKDIVDFIMEVKEKVKSVFKENMITSIEMVK